jgi:hypothetical protein
MNILNRIILIQILSFVLVSNLYSQDNRSFKIFQFPPNRIPTIDGQSNDWDMVPKDYVVGTDQLWDDSKRHPAVDTTNLNVSVKVGWVKGLNRLYFLYEAYDDYWDFSEPGLHNDTYELVVDGDQSGGPFIDRFHPNKTLDPMDAYFSFHGVHAQNYHIFTPAVGKDWTLAWGCQPWIKELPFANVAYDYNFKHGESGNLTLEFWITPFDYAGNEGPERAVKSVLKENKDVGLCWAIIDYDKTKEQGGFWNLSKEHTMYGNANHLLPFKLMPLEPEFRKVVEARWSFKIIDMNRRLVAFQDESVGEITTWKWDFGDGETSNEQHPQHIYKEPGKYVVVLWVEGPQGKSRFSKVWDVALQ